VSAISPGVATITVTTTDGAFKDTAVIQIISKPDSSTTLAFAPNPYRLGQTLIINGLPQAVFNIYLFNKDGKLIRKLGQEYTIDGILEINIASTPQGLYFLFLLSDDSSFEKSLKLLIE
ncbi:T9SS type A sorting domain-containing protein, partial [Aureicoccus marinus]